MNATITHKADEPCRFAVEGELTIYTALDMKDKLLATLGQCADVEIDLAGVSEFDSAGMQLLVLLKQEAGKQGKTLRISGHSPAVLELFELCQLEGFFGDPVLIISQE